MQTYSATGSAKAIGAEEDDLDSARLGQWVREQGRAETKNTQLRSAARLFWRVLLSVCSKKLQDCSIFAQFIASKFLEL